MIKLEPSNNYYVVDIQNNIHNVKYFVEDVNTISFIDEMLEKYSDHHIYLHNFSKFDGIFLLKIITSISDNIKFLIRDNNLLTISLSFDVKLDDNSRKCTIHFHDSLLLLPSSLAKLAFNFGVENKGSFNFSKINNATNNKKLNMLREELLDYNKQDCLVLYQVMAKFAKQIFNLYSLNLTKYPTLSSLSFAIFRSNFLDKEIIPISNINDYNFITESYRGGHSSQMLDVYRPYTKKGNKVYCYDINSLYPSVMASNDFPVGTPKYFTGPRDLQDLFGFIKVNVTCPEMFCPVLLTKHNDKTIAPIGS